MLSRRELLTQAARAAVAGVAAPWLQATASAQPPAQILPGKDKLIVRSLRPPDYETPVELLDSWLTPLDYFYVRCHMPVPAGLDAHTWTLQIEGEVGTPLTLTMADLRKMPAATVTSVLECAGNGRAFFDPPVAGVQWTRGAVGNARWTGVRLADLLKRAGLRPSARVVTMNGADRGMGQQPDFIRQLPLDKAMHPDTLVAYEMNGEPLPVVHGFPLRLIVPGWEGAYWMKWLTTLRVLDRDFDGFWVATAYRYPTRRVAPGASVDPREMAPLTGLTVKSLITRPLEGSVLPRGEITVAGFAWAGEADIDRVDISVDDGATWHRAQLVGERIRYAWRRFEFSFQASRAESCLIMSRATDADGRTQPLVPPWNPSGYLWNAPDMVRVEIAT
jgi:DMSO/TMAO reductase YedYZ molybdopterin-dependent catalytic subunit